MRELSAFLFLHECNVFQTLLMQNKSVKLNMCFLYNAVHTKTMRYASLANVFVNNSVYDGSISYQ